MLEIAELTSAWAHGWATSRGRPAPIPIAGGLRIDLGPPDKPARYVLHTHDPEMVARLGHGLTAPGTEIKAVGNPEALSTALAHDWTMYPPCDLMTSTFAQAEVDLTAPYTARIDNDGGALLGLIFDADGDIASSARLAPFGRYGIIDQVCTRPPHRRRGLGSSLMAMLGNQAVGLSLSTGVLAATDNGRALYRTLGWTTRGELAGAFRSPAPAERGATRPAGS